MTADQFIKKSLLTILILLVAGLAFFAVWQMGNRGQSTLTDSQKVLYKQYFALAANRTAYMELSILDPKSPSYSVEKANVFEQIERTNLEAAELISQAKDYTFSIEGVGERHQEMVEESIAVLKVQQEIFQEYKRTEEIVSIIYTYEPSFITLETDLDDEALLANTIQAREEFVEIREKLEDLDGGAMAVSELIDGIDVHISYLEELENYLRSSDAGSVETALNKIIEHSEILKEKAIELLRGTITDQNSVNMLTDLTNLVLEYRFYLEGE